MAKLTDEDVKGIIKCYQEGMNFTEIGKKYNVTRTTIKRKLKSSGVYNLDLSTKECEYCHTKFSPSKYGYDVQKYCSNTCRLKSFDETKKPRLKTCVHCKKEFYTKSVNKAYCTDECYNDKLAQDRENKRREFNRTRVIKMYTYDCPQCHKKGLSKYKKTYCSRICADRMLSYKKKCKKRRFRKCQCCNKFHYTGYKFCSDSCRKINSRNQKEKRMTLARQNGQFDADIDIYRLIERDGEQCYLCGDVVLFNTHFNDPKYPTIEHVIPISKGGTHSWDNVKVACRDCNTRKSTKNVELFLKEAEYGGTTKKDVG